MSADSFDNFEYEKASEHTSQAACGAIVGGSHPGLQDVDGLSVSPYLREVSGEYVAGNATLSETGRLIRQHHEAGGDSEHAEADLVSQRIAELLASGAFYLAPRCSPPFTATCSGPPAVYHRRVQNGAHGETRGNLNGDSVLYADPITLRHVLARRVRRRTGTAVHHVHPRRAKGVLPHHRVPLADSPRSRATRAQLRCFRDCTSTTWASASRTTLRNARALLSRRPYPGRCTATRRRTCSPTTAS